MCLMFVAVICAVALLNPTNAQLAINPLQQPVGGANIELVLPSEPPAVQAPIFQPQPNPAQYVAPSSIHDHRAAFQQRPNDQLHTRHSVIEPITRSLDHSRYINQYGSDDVVISPSDREFVSLDASGTTESMRFGLLTDEPITILEIKQMPPVFVLHVKAPFAQVHRTQLTQSLNETGYTLGAYLPHMSVLLLPDRTANVSRLMNWHKSHENEVLAMIEYDAPFKMDPELLVDIDHLNSSTVDQIWQLTAILHNSLVDDESESLQHPINQWRRWTKLATMSNVMLQQKAANLIGVTIHLALADDEPAEKITQQSSPRQLTIESLRKFIAFLSSDSRVAWIERVAEFETLNRHASLLAQNGRFDQPPLMYSHGLTGRDQIISVGDTGIDSTSCFFADPDRALPVNSVDPLHRKIVAYYATQNKTWDHPNGHGSHTAGSIAGKIANVQCRLDSATQLNSGTENSQSLDGYDGVARDAKLVVFDLNDGKTRSAIRPPHDIIKGYFEPSLAAGASISSNSWGAKIHSFYLKESRAIDQFTYESSTFLPIFAAGNFGMKGLMTSVAPSTAKNTLSIGSVRSSKLKINADTNQPDLCGSEQLNEETDVDRVLSFFSSRGPTQDLRVKPEIVFAGEWIVSARSHGQPTPGQDTALSINQSCCHSCLGALLPLFGTSMSTAVAAGAAALVRQYYTDGYYPNGIATAEYAFVPSAALLKATMIAAAVNDVYDEADPTSVNPANPSAAVNSGALSYAPRIGSGWGRVELSSALSFQDDDLSPDLFIVDQRPIGQSDVHTYCFKPRRNTSPLPFKATLVWTDPPAEMSSSWLLINDLDLAVQYNASATLEEKLLLGNGQLSHGKPVFDQVNNAEVVLIDSDDMKLPQQAMAVLIRGSNIPSTANNEGSIQNYSLVVTGHFTVHPISHCPGSSICPNSCSNHGRCAESGACVCERGWGAADCSQQAEVLQGCGWKEAKQLDLASWDYYQLNMPKSVSDNPLIEWQFQTRHQPDAGADIDVYVNRDSLPSLVQFNTSDRSTAAVSAATFVVDERESNLMFGGVHSYCCAPVAYQVRICSSDADRQADECSC